MTENQRHNIYAGYQAYDYLVDDRDYRSYDMVDQLKRVPPYDLELSPTEEVRAKRLLADNVAISLHDHPDVFPKNPALFVDYQQEGRAVLGYQGLAVSGLDCIFDNMADGTTIITSKRGWKWTDVIHDLGMRLSDIAHQDFVVIGRRVSDILAAHQNGQVALVPTIESAMPIENELERLEILYGFGVRMMGVTYSESNALGSGLREPTDAGLTLFGREAVRLMNQVGIAIDVSHCGDQTSLDTIKASSKPVFISHAGARALWNTRRLKPDEVLTACAASGGVIGIEAAPHTTLTVQHPRHNLESVMEHFEYCVELVGIDHVTFGPDTLFGDHVALHHVFASYLSTGQAHGTVEHEETDYVAGMEHPAEAFPNVVRWLVKHSYSDDEIARVIGGNTLRALRHTW